MFPVCTDPNCPRSMWNEYLHKYNQIGPIEWGGHVNTGPCDLRALMDGACVQDGRKALSDGEGAPPSRPPWSAASADGRCWRTVPAVRSSPLAIVFLQVTLIWYILPPSWSRGHEACFASTILIRGQQFLCIFHSPVWFRLPLLLLLGCKWLHNITLLGRREVSLKILYQSLISSPKASTHLHVRSTKQKLHERCLVKLQVMNIILLIRNLANKSTKLPTELLV